MKGSGFGVFLAGVLLFRGGMAVEAWERALPGDPAVRQMLERRCRNDAVERIYETLENISLVRLEVQGTGAFEDVFISSDVRGIAYSKPWMWRFAPVAMEVDAQRFPQPLNRQSLPVARLRMHRPDEFRSNFTARIALVYERVTTDDEEKQGVYGRRIRVVEHATGKVYGERTEFFWLSPPGFQRGRLLEGALCPSLGVAQTTPSYFFNRVVNPKTVTCAEDFSRRHAELDPLPWPPPSDLPAREKRGRQGLELAEAMGKCILASFDKLPPLPE